jgi:hypothetical protein
MRPGRTTFQLDLMLDIDLTHVASTSAHTVVTIRWSGRVAHSLRKIG